MRTTLPLLAALTCLTLSGCISGSAQSVFHPVPVAAVPKDLHILQSIPLDQGTATTYTFDLSPGWTSAHVSLKVVGSLTPLAHQDASYCVDWTAPFGKGESGNKCPVHGVGNIVVQGGPPMKPGESVLIDWSGDKLVAGHYDLELNAESQLNHFVYQVDVEYAQPSPAA